MLTGRGPRAQPLPGQRLHELPVERQGSPLVDRDRGGKRGVTVSPVAISSASCDILNMLSSFLFVLAICLAAAQIFLLESIIGKQLLPLAGGGPMIWNTCLVFFQLALLAAYSIAFLLSRIPSALIQRVVISLWILAALVTPGFLRDGVTSAPPLGQNPELWLWSFLITSVGFYFCSIGVLSPMLQHWFSRIAPNKDPYPLYAASNLGSLLGILAYPLFLERTLTLGENRSLLALLGWSLLALIIGICFLAESKLKGPQTLPSLGKRTQTGKGAIVRWVALSAVPSSLLLSVTTYILTDINALPLFWMLPLVVYIGSFIIAFGRLDRLNLHLVQRLVSFLILPIVITFLLEANSPPALLIPLHLLTFGLAALLCHGLLVSSRPQEHNDLTQFYLWISFGGALGGILTLFVAPLIFDRQFEYVIGLVLVCLFRGFVSGSDRDRPQLDVRDGIKAALIVGLVLIGARVAATVPESWGSIRFLVLFVPAGFVVLSDIQHPRRYAMLLVVLMLVGTLNPSGLGTTISATRNFFGLTRVTELDGFHRVVHGSTIHGSQLVSQMDRCVPGAYYHRSGPAGLLLSESSSAGRSVLVIGLGVGSLVCYAQPQDAWTFYELNPAMSEIAHNRELFSYVPNAPTENLTIKIGDGRRLLESETDAKFDVIVVDAFSSDAIPTHLLNLEAFKLYLSRLKQGGEILLHVSNRFFDLGPVVGNLANELGLEAFVSVDVAVDSDAQADGKIPSTWVVVVPDRADGAPLKSLPASWHRIEPDGARVWTDEYADPVSALVW